MTGIVILNYNTWYLSIRCMESIPKNRYRIYLVDNASPIRPTSEEKSYINDRDDVTEIFASDNRGYAAGNNLGIQRALEDGCDNIIISNSDIVFRTGSIDHMTNALSEDDRIGIAGPKVIGERGEIQRSRISMKTGMAEKIQLYTGLKHIFRNKWNRYFCLDRSADEKQEVYHVLGCCFAISSACAKDVMPYDENTFLYEEELILGIRMEEAHWRTVYEPKAVVDHLYGATTNTVAPFAYRCIYDSEQYYMREYLHASDWQLKLMSVYRRFMYDVHCISNKEFREYRGKFRHIG